MSDERIVRVSRGTTVESLRDPEVNVLLVTDDASLAKAIGTILEELRYEALDRAINEQEAVRILKKKRPDVVIVDLNVSGISGFKVTRAILAQRAVPVLLTFEPEDDALVKDDKSSGALAYLVKPPNGIALDHAIRVAVARFEELSILREQAKDLKDALESSKIVEKAKSVLVRRLGVSEVEAFERLKQESTSQCKKLKEVCEAVIVADKML